MSRGRRRGARERGCQLGAGAVAALAKHRSEVPLDGLRAEEQGSADLAVGEALRSEQGDPGLLRGQRLVALGRAASAWRRWPRAPGRPARPRGSGPCPRTPTGPPPLLPGGDPLAGPTQPAAVQQPGAGRLERVLTELVCLHRGGEGASASSSSRAVSAGTGRAERRQRRGLGRRHSRVAHGQCPRVVEPAQPDVRLDQQRRDAERLPGGTDPAVDGEARLQPPTTPARSPRQRAQNAAVSA